MNKVATVNKPKERQTPIEIALQIDGQGMTTTKALYSFLELHSTQYSRWVKSNIENNRFAEVGVDYFLLDTDVECRKSGVSGRFASNYKLTASFAKKLAMGSNSPKGEEARDYFVQVEQNAKKLANSYEVQDELEMIAVMSREMVAQRRLSREQQVRLTAIEQTTTGLQEKVEAVKNAFVQEEENWREMIHKNIDKIVDATGRDHQEIWNESYTQLDRHGFDLGKRLKNRRERMVK